MKWHKLETNFWDSQTHEILDEALGAKGVLAYLKLISHICLRLHSASDVEHVSENGFSISYSKLRKICNLNEKKLINLISILHKNEKVFSEFKENFGVNRVVLKFKNFREFVDKNALNSKFRSLKKEDPGAPARGPDEGLNKIREDKIKELDNLSKDKLSLVELEPPKKVGEPKSSAPKKRKAREPKPAADADVIAVIEHLNAKAHKSFRADTWQTPIRSILNRGYSVTQLMEVIDRKVKDPYFRDNPQYLRPQTLFGSARKVEAYLNEGDKLSDIERFKFLEKEVENAASNVSEPVKATV